MRTYLKSFAGQLGEFLADVGSNWVGLMSGIIGVLLWALGAFMEPLPVSLRWSSLLIALPALLFACFLGWRKRMPRLVGYIDQSVVGVPTHDPGSTVLTITMSIKNTGVPSIADNWEISERLPNGCHVTGRHQRISGCTLMDSTGMPARVLNEEDALYAKAIQPIPTGGMIRGVLMAIIPGRLRSEVNVKGTQVIVTFEDVFGRHHQSCCTLKGEGVPL